MPIVGGEDPGGSDNADQPSDSEEPSESDEAPTADWGWRSETEALESALEEARRSYDKEVDTLNEIDDRAMRAGRTGLIVLGIVVSAFAVFDPGTIDDFSRQVMLTTAIGTGLVVISTVFALGTHTITEYPSGIGEPHRESALEDRNTNPEWLAFMIEQYGEWSDEATDEIEANAEYLEKTMSLLITGILGLVLAASVGYLHKFENINPNHSLGVFIIGTPLLWAGNWLYRRYSE